jgi:hypothetical protein
VTNFVEKFKKLLSAIMPMNGYSNGMQEKERKVFSSVRHQTIKLSLCWNKTFKSDSPAYEMTDLKEVLASLKENVPELQEIKGRKEQTLNKLRKDKYYKNKRIDARIREAVAIYKQFTKGVREMMPRYRRNLILDFAWDPQTQSYPESFELRKSRYGQTKNYYDEQQHRVNMRSLKRKLGCAKRSAPSTDNRQNKSPCRVGECLKGSPQSQEKKMFTNGQEDWVCDYCARFWTSEYGYDFTGWRKVRIKPTAKLFKKTNPIWQEHPDTYLFVRRAADSKGTVDLQHDEWLYSFIHKNERYNSVPCSELIPLE